MRAPSPTLGEQQYAEAMLPPNNIPAVVQQPSQQIVQQPMMPQTGFTNIATALSDIMSEIGVIGEGGENKFQNYKYMSYKDMYRKLTPLMGKHGLSVIPTEKHRSIFDNDAVVSATYSFTILHKSGEVWPFQPEWTGVSRARDSKGGWDDKALNKCATAAQKYFLKALFQIPSGDEDEDPDHHDGSVQRAPKVRAPSPPKAEPVSPFRAKGANETEWTEDLLRMIQKAKSKTDLDAVDNSNAEALDRLSVKHPALYRKAYDAFVTRKKEFAKADPISSGAFILRHGGDPVEFKNKVMDLMDTAASYAALETIYNDHVAPIEQDLFPADKDDLLSAFRRNENRLN